jgi:p-hydroxybenzoate 3-monooxygenase
VVEAIAHRPLRRQADLTLRTQVAIIGGGPAGLMLGRLLELAGIDAVIIEQRSAEYVLGRIRAGVLEEGSVALMERVGLAERLHREGLPHRGIEMSFDGVTQRIDFDALIGRHVVVYGQTELTRDLMSARRESGGAIVHEAEHVTIEGFDSAQPQVRYRMQGREHVVECDFIAGCDGFHGVCRASVPDNAIEIFERHYPIGWLGVLVDQPPVADELIYAHHERGFALCSMRSAARSRYYVQVAATERAEDWTDNAFWDELRSRLNPATAAQLKTGPSIEKSIAPLRSFVAEPLRFGTLFLAGDAAHIVPPTGAKGLNLALHDVRLLGDALQQHYGEQSRAGLDSYSDRALSRIWLAERFSWWMTSLLHAFPETGAFGRRIQRAEFDNLLHSEAARRNLAENYAGLADGDALAATETSQRA